MKKVNVAIFVLGLFSSLCIGILFHFGKIQNFDRVLLIIASVFALIMLVANCMQNWFKSIVITIVAFLIIAGFGKLTVLTGYVGTYAYASINNLLEMNKILSDETTIKLFSYDGYEYYTNANYSQMYKVKKNGIFSSIDATTILIEKDAYDVLTEHFGIFYEINNNVYFSDIENAKISISAPIGQKDEIVFVKIINKDNKVFYSYLNPDNPVRLFQEMGIVSKIYTIGNTTMLVAKPTKVIDGTNNDSSVESSKTQQYILTITGQKIISSYVAEVQFENNVLYHSRINYFLYKESFLEIDLLEQAMLTLEKDSDEYKTAETKLTELKAQIISYTCELCYEDIGTDYQLRLYRVFLPTSGLTETPDMTLVEIKYGDIYWYGSTDLKLDEIK